MKSYNTKEILYKLWKKDPNNTKKRVEYKKYNNLLTYTINKAKEMYDKKPIEANMSNPKKLEVLVLRTISLV